MDSTCEECRTGFCAYATTSGGSNLLFDRGYDEELQFYPSRYFDRKILNISGLVLSHFDQDHVANLAALHKVVNFNSIIRNGTAPAVFIRKQKEVGGVITTAMASAIYMQEHWIHP